MKELHFDLEKAASINSPKHTRATDHWRDEGYARDRYIHKPKSPSHCDAV